MRGIQNYHMDVQGWSDIGYHFLVNANGDLYEGRSGSMSSIPRGAHDACNDNSFGFNIMGYFHPPYNQVFTAASKNSIDACIAWRMPTGWSATGSGTYCGSSVPTLCGHYQVVATACPGDGIIPSLASMRTDVATKRSCGAGKTAVIKDNTAANYVGTWATGTSAADKYGADYRYHSTAPVSEPATWTANLNVTATWNVRVWYPAGSNRSTTASYLVSHAGGTTTAVVNQQITGGQWVLQGSWSMNAGNNNVALSVWTTTGYIVVADAVKWD